MLKFENLVRNWVDVLVDLVDPKAERVGSQLCGLGSFAKATKMCHCFILLLFPRKRKKRSHT